MDIDLLLRALVHVGVLFDGAYQLGNAGAGVLDLLQQTADREGSGDPGEQVLQHLLWELAGDIIQPGTIASGAYQDWSELPRAVDPVALQAGAYAVLAIAALQRIPRIGRPLPQLLFEHREWQPAGAGQFVRVQPRGRLAKSLESFGPPFPGNAERDRAGLGNAVAVLRRSVAGRIFLGGHSYGGRQATILCAAEPELVSGLLLLSYPLHPPRKPERLRVQHLSNLRVRSLFVHGTRDPFGSIEEMTKALQLIPAKTELMKVEGAGHDLGFKGKARAQELPSSIFAGFDEMFS